MALSSPRVRYTVLAIAGAIAVAFVSGALTGSSLAAPSGGNRPRGEARAQRAAPRDAVFVYGDSLVTQAEPYLSPVARALGMKLRTRAFGGIAPCDELASLGTDLRQLRPAIVVFAFSGNSFTDCMRGANGALLQGDQLVAKYHDDLEAAARITTLAGVPLVLASPPASNQRMASWDQLDAVYREVAAAHQPEVQYTDAGVQIAPDGQFVATQRCLPFELNLPEAESMCRSGDNTIDVRAPDGVHFCSDVVTPKPNPTPCTRYSSGALRYAIALVTAAKLQLDYLAASPALPATRSR
jgi:hypothetical protein